jgi:hypothetical protein
MVKISLTQAAYRPSRETEMNFFFQFSQIYNLLRDKETIQTSSFRNERVKRGTEWQRMYVSFYKARTK